MKEKKSYKSRNHGIEKQVSLSWLYKPSTLTNKWDAEV